MAKINLKTSSETPAAINSAVDQDWELEDNFFPAGRKSWAALLASFHRLKATIRLVC